MDALTTVRLRVRPPFEPHCRASTRKSWSIGQRENYSSALPAQLSCYSCDLKYISTLKHCMFSPHHVGFLPSSVDNPSTWLRRAGIQSLPILETDSCLLGLLSGVLLFMPRLFHNAGHILRIKDESLLFIIGLGSFSATVAIASGCKTPHTTRCQVVYSRTHPTHNTTASV